MTGRGFDFGDKERQGQLTGVIEKVIYANPENLYCVASLATDSGEVIIVGPLGSLGKGERLNVFGEYTSHPKFGRQFKVSHFKVQAPEGEEGVKSYLGSGLISGVGPALAERIVARFGAETLDIIRDDPDRLLEIKGIGKKTLKRIRGGLEKRREMEGLALFLQSHGLPPGLTVKLFKWYGTEALAQVRQNPYILIEDVTGIGFKKADLVALKIGFEKNSAIRLRAGLVHILGLAGRNGDVYLPEEEALERASKLLLVDINLLRQEMEALGRSKGLIIEDPQPELAGFMTNRRSVFLPGLWEAEQTTAHGLRRIRSGPKWFNAKSAEKAIRTAAQDMDPEPSREQRQALVTSLAGKLTVITGGPGTGKTTIIKALVRAVEAGEGRLALCAPTGRAAKRLSLASGRPASTIHRLLEYSPRDGFQFHDERQLPLEFLIVDEASMVDINLMASLVRALNERTSLVLVGDSDQLPAVGPGQVLTDLINSKAAQVVRLTKIYRQSAESRIIGNAHRIRQGRPPSFEDGGDYFFIHQEDPERVADLILRMATERIPARFGFDPFSEIQVLAPMRRGVCGVELLNANLGRELNPNGREIMGGRLKVGDKVIQTVNNYDRMTFNGDLGRILDMDSDGHVYVDLEGERKVYDPEGVIELVPAYCLSIHKSQGSEYPAVIIPILTEHTVMLTRNLIYTGLTRAKKLVVLVGSKRMTTRAATSRRQTSRRSLLGHRLNADPEPGGIRPD